MRIHGVEFLHMRKVLLLGASGSIGTQTLDLLRLHRDRFSLVGFSVGLRDGIISEVLRDFPEVKTVYLRDAMKKAEYQRQYPSILFVSEEEGWEKLFQEADADMVVNALVGFSGMVPSILALKRNSILCLANKESLVVGGALIRDELAKGHGKLYPIDSEHVAIAKLFSKVKAEDIETLYITASGGSFRDKKRDELTKVTKDDALAHPTWSMGAKITIDSATMMNKGFEVIEARWLYDFPLEKTKIIMHKQSYVHSLVLKKDGTWVADVSAPDMHGPIEYALMESNVDFELKTAEKLADLGPFDFAEFDPQRYPAVGIALDSYRRGGNSPAVLNASNEEAVYAFLDGYTPFLSIEELVSVALDYIPYIEKPTLDELISTDQQARKLVRTLCRREC